MKPDFNFNEAALARAYRVDVRTIARWVKAGLPSKRQGRYRTFELAETIAWVRKRDEGDAQARLEAAVARIDPADAKGRKTCAEAALLELKLQRERGEVALLADIEEIEAHKTVAIRESVMAVAGNLVQQGLVKPGDEPAVAVVCRDALVVAAGNLVDWAETELERSQAAEQEKP